MKPAKKEAAKPVKKPRKRKKLPKKVWVVFFEGEHVSTCFSNEIAEDIIDICSSNYGYRGKYTIKKYIENND